MKEFVEKLISRLKNRIKYNELCHKEFPNAKMNFTYEVQINAYKNAIEIVNQLAEEYINCSTNISTDKSTTNADRIRNMSDEEMAEFFHIIDHFWHDDEYLVNFGDDETIHDTKENILEWLQSEVEGSE